MLIFGHSLLNCQILSFYSLYKLVQACASLYKCLKVFCLLADVDAAAAASVRTACQIIPVAIRRLFGKMGDSHTNPEVPVDMRLRSNLALSEKQRFVNPDIGKHSRRKAYSHFDGGHCPQDLQGFSTSCIIAALREGKTKLGCDGECGLLTAYARHYTTPEGH